MSNKKKKQRKGKKIEKNKKIISMVLGAILILLLILLIALICHNKNLGKIENAQEKKQEKTVGITFPYKLADGELEVDSLFQFTGTNPDCGDEDGEDIAALTVINTSNKYLLTAAIQAELSNGNKLSFEIKDLPAGESVMVFEKNNESYELSDTCASLTGTTEFAEDAECMEDKLSIDVQETTITLTNIAGEDLTNLLLHCHCLVDDAYFGGLTYSYPIEGIPAGQSVTVQADECYLGTAAVVRVSQDNGEE